MNIRDMITTVNARAAGMDVGKDDASVHWTGRLSVPPEELRDVLNRGWLMDGLSGWAIDALDAARGKLVLAPKPNLVVNSGINRRLDRLFGIGGPPAVVDSMGVDNGTVNPSATTDRSADGNSTSRTILAFDSTATRSSQVVSCVRTFTNATVAFTMKRLFLSAGTGDAAGTLHSMTNVFTMDLSAFSTWSQTFTAQVTGTGS